MKIFTMGNDAMAQGAIAAGARFFAGYPITPSSEVAEISARKLPEVGGVFVQMEDELGSIAAIIGASASGKKSYTATSGPGFSLMQENLGVAVMAEVPCVIINVQRSGPSTGLATKPAQGDYMQARYGTHGDHGIIAISPSSVQECYDYMITAFNLAERHRTPVVFLADEVVGHMREAYEPWEPKAEDIINRTAPTCAKEDFELYNFEGHPYDVAPMPAYGGDYVFRINGSGHDNVGAPCGVPANADRFVRHFTDKFEKYIDDITIVNKFMLDDADIVMVTFGCSVRSAKAAMKKAREKGIKVGLLQIVTVWPFPSKLVGEICKGKKAVIVPEMNLGQMAGEVKKATDIPVIGVNRVDSLIITPTEILAAIEEVAK